MLCIRLLLLQVQVEEADHSADIGRAIYEVGATVVGLRHDPQLFRRTCGLIEQMGVLWIDYRVLLSLDQQHGPGCQATDLPQLSFLLHIRYNYL